MPRHFLTHQRQWPQIGALGLKDSIGSIFFGFYPVAALRSGCGAIDPEDQVGHWSQQGKQETEGNPGQGRLRITLV